MASFTIPFKDVLRMDSSIEEEVLANYPIFNEDYRPWLNQQIKDEYWNREIGQETISMFKLALKRKLNQIMPYYNKQYKADLLADGADPLQTLRVVNETENLGNTTSNGESTSESTSDSAARQIGSDFPQHMLSADGDYASTGGDTTSRATSDSKAGEKATTQQESTGKSSVTGTNGQTSVLIMQHRQTLINVDVMLLSDLDDLFMQIWSTSDDYSSSSPMTAHKYSRLGLSGHFW